MGRTSRLGPSIWRRRYALPKFSATRHLCLVFDILVNGWQPQLDAEQIAGALAQARTTMTVRDLASLLGIDPRRMNVAVEQQQRWGVIGCSGNVDATSPVISEIWPISAIDPPATGARRRRP